MEPHGQVTVGTLGSHILTQMPQLLVPETPGVRCPVGGWVPRVLGESAAPRPPVSEKHLFPQPSRSCLRW